MKSKQINNKSTKLVRLDTGLHTMLKLKAFKSSMTIKEALGECVEEYVSLDGGLHHETK